ncbi:MAG: hypothetical protein GY817_07460 [bacterium]|nr:hypothetical protein [bacterium]
MKKDIIKIFSVVMVIFIISCGDNKKPKTYSDNLDYTEQVENKGIKSPRTALDSQSQAPNPSQISPITTDSPTPTTIAQSNDNNLLERQNSGKINSRTDCNKFISSRKYNDVISNELQFKVVDLNQKLKQEYEPLKNKFVDSIKDSLDSIKDARIKKFMCKMFNDARIKKLRDNKDEEMFKLSKNPFEVSKGFSRILYVLDGFLESILKNKPKDINTNEISNKLKKYRDEYLNILEGSYKHLLTALLVSYEYRTDGVYVHQNHQNHHKVFFSILNQVIEKTYNSRDKEFYISTIDFFGWTRKGFGYGESIIATLDYGKTFHILKKDIDYRVKNYNSKKHKNHVEIELLSRKYHDCKELNWWET